MRWWGRERNTTYLIVKEYAFKLWHIMKLIKRINEIYTLGVGVVLIYIILCIGIPVLLKSDRERERKPLPYVFVFLYVYELLDKDVRVRYQTVNTVTSRDGITVEGGQACL